MFRWVTIVSLFPVYAGFSLDLLFDPEDGGDIFIRNAGPEHRTLYCQ
jgi:hypothetical protein